MTRLSVLLSTLLLTACAANAAILNIGSPNTAPDIWTGASIQASATVIYDSGAKPFSFDGGLTFGQYEEYVATDTNNTFCAGCLDFALRISVDPGSTYSISTVRFGTWASRTDVGYITGLVGPGAIAPNTVFRGGGNNVGFNFSGLAPGATSQIVIVETDARGMMPGGIFFNDSNNNAQSGTFGSIFVPSPEPSSLTLAGIALLVLGGSYLRRRMAR